jgi:hypothetical protein
MQLNPPSEAACPSATQEFPNNLWNPLDVQYKCHSFNTLPLETFRLFFNSNSEGGVQLGPLDTSATNWPVVLASGNYADGEFGGMVIGKQNRSTRRKPTTVLFRPPQIPHDLTRRQPWQPQWEASD